MSVFLLFENKRLATILDEVIRNERPKSDLEKTEWWSVLIFESMIDKEIADFIRISWPSIHPRFIFDELSHLSGRNFAKPKVNNFLRNILLDKKLIQIIEEEQKDLTRKKIYNLPLNGPIPKSVKLKTTNKGEIDCVATQEINGEKRAYHDAYSFLIDLSNNWIRGLEAFSPESIFCENQIFENLSDKQNEEKDSELAEIIFSNFPKTFDYCEKDYYLYICSWNWNFTKCKN